MLKPVALFVSVVTAVSTLSGCQTTGTVGGSSGISSRYGSLQRKHLDTRLKMSDFLKFAETTSNKILGSNRVHAWIGEWAKKQDRGNPKPKLVVGRLLNHTYDETIMIADIKDRIVKQLLRADMFRVVDKSSTEFDCIMKMELSERRQGKDEELAEFMLKISLNTLDGEIIDSIDETMDLKGPGKSFM